MKSPSLHDSVRTVVGIALALTLLACGGKPAGPAGGGSAAPAGGGSKPGAAGIDYTGQMQCIDGKSTTRAPIVLKKVEECSYFGGAVNRLVLQFAHGGPDARDLTVARINGFKAAGTFPTTDGENDTDTYVQTHGYNDTPEPDGSHTGPGGTSAGAADCRGACTITITDASVTGTPVGEKGHVVGSIDCTSLAAAGTGCVKCTVTPPKMDFDIAGCDHHE